mmetsp:Transcript_35068/g.104852  ORF Transcript_35068/g.104852 Transcript_35068/m.104852 type:complete len:227 (-) Transcript_35068:406-1086(-)
MFAKRLAPVGGTIRGSPGPEAGVVRVAPTTMAGSTLLNSLRAAIKTPCQCSICWWTRSTGTLSLGGLRLSRATAPLLQLETCRTPSTAPSSARYSRRCWTRRLTLTRSSGARPPSTGGPGCTAASTSASSRRARRSTSSIRPSPSRGPGRPSRTRRAAAGGSAGRGGSGTWRFATGRHTRSCCWASTPERWVSRAARRRTGRARPRRRSWTTGRCGRAPERSLAPA